MLALRETGRPPRNRTEFPGLKDRCIGHECLQPIWRPGPTPRRPPLAPICAPYPTASPKDAETGHARWSRTTRICVCCAVLARRADHVRERESEGAKARSTGDNGVSHPVRRAPSPLGGKKLPVGDTDGPECQSLRTPGLEASGRGASQRQQWWTPAGSNRRPLRCKRSALPLS